MTVKILFLYSTYEGQTAKIMARIAQDLQQYEQLSIEQINIVTTENIPYLTDYDAVLIGSSIRYGHYHKKIKAFIDNNIANLSVMPSAFFGINLVARKESKNTTSTNGYTRKFLDSILWRPKLAAVFAGRLDYSRYGFFDRLMIRLIMKMTKGETDPKAVIEYTDWSQVDEFANQFYQLIQTR